MGFAQQVTLDDVAPPIKQYMFTDEPPAGLDGLLVSVTFNDVRRPPRLSTQAFVGHVV